MTDEQRDINRRVAVALGMAVTLFDTDGVTKVGEMWTYEKRILGLGTWYDLPDFCSDPAAAAILKGHMKAQGWEYRTGWDKKRGHWAEVEPNTAQREPIYPAWADTEEEALAVAFLGACEATA